MSQKLKVLIMCGGRGKRLGKISEQIPKSLNQINDKSILELKIDQYGKQGLKDFIFCIGYKGELIKQEVERFKNGFETIYSEAGQEAGILKRLYTAKKHYGDQVFMTYGDTITDIEVNSLWTEHKKSGNEATIVVAPVKNPFGLVEYDKDKKVTFFKEKPILNYYIGYAIINKSAFNYAPKKIIEMPDGDGLVMFYKILMAMDKIGVYYHDGIQITFNTSRELKTARKQFNQFYTAH